MTSEQIKTILNECKNEINESFQDREKIKNYIISHSDTTQLSSKDVDIFVMSVTKSLELSVKYVDKLILKLFEQLQ